MYRGYPRICWLEPQSQALRVEKGRPLAQLDIAYGFGIREFQSESKGNMNNSAQKLASSSIVRNVVTIIEL